MLPLFGVIAFLLPLMVGGEIGPIRLAYVFSAWFVLILSSMLLARHLGRGVGQDEHSTNSISTVDTDAADDAGGLR